MVRTKINSQFSESASPISIRYYILRAMAEVFSMTKYPVNRELAADEFE
jgi:hypothetical protein